MRLIATLDHICMQAQISLLNLMITQLYSLYRQTHVHDAGIISTIMEAQKYIKLYNSS